MNTCWIKVLIFFFIYIFVTQTIEQYYTVFVYWIYTRIKYNLTFLHIYEIAPLTPLNAF